MNSTGEASSSLAFLPGQSVIQAHSLYHPISFNIKILYCLADFRGNHFSCYEISPCLTLKNLSYGFSTYVLMCHFLFFSAFCDFFFKDRLNILYALQFRKIFLFVTLSRYCEFSAQDKDVLAEEIVLGDLKCMPYSLFSEGDGSRGC